MNGNGGDGRSEIKVSFAGGCAAAAEPRKTLVKTDRAGCERIGVNTGERGRDIVGDEDECVVVEYEIQCGRELDGPQKRFCSVTVRRARDMAKALKLGLNFSVGKNLNFLGVGW